MRKYLIAATVALACSPFIAGDAHAATTTFNVSGTFVGCASCSLGGNVVIDTTTGLFVSEDVTTGLSGVGPFTSLQSGSPFVASGHLVAALADGNLAHNLDLIFPIASLIGYTGGQLCGISPSNCGGTMSVLTTGTAGSPFSLASGSLTAVPLPGALSLFATGLGALGLLGWRRKRKA